MENLRDSLKQNIFTLVYIKFGPMTSGEAVTRGHRTVRAADQNLPRRSRGWDAGTEPCCSQQKSICNNNEAAVPTMLGTTVSQNCNYLDVQGLVPQSAAQLSDLSITNTKSRHTRNYFIFFSFLTGHHADTLISAPLSFLPLSSCLSTDENKNV